MKTNSTLLEGLKTHFLWKYAFLKNGVLTDLDARADSIFNVARMFYVIIFFLVFEQIGSIGFYLENTPSFPLWPVDIFRFIPFGYLIHGLFFLILPLLLITSLWIRIRAFRILCMLPVIMVMSLKSSYGKIDHNYHHLLFPLVGFVFLPTKNSSEIDLKAGLVLVGSQMLILFAYSLSGLLKFVNGFIQLIIGEYGIFSEYSLSFHLIKRAVSYGRGTDVGVWVIDHPMAGSILMLGAVYLELGSVFILFKKNLHRLWGVGLILMHTGISLVMNINFSTPVLLLGLLFIASPLAPKEIKWRSTLTSLPFLGGLLDFILFSRRKVVQENILFYDDQCGFCNKFIRLLMNNKVSNMKFAPLGGAKFNELGLSDAYLHVDTLIFYENEFDINIRNRAVFKSLWSCSSSIRFLSLFLVIIPLEISNIGYRVVSYIRKRLIQLDQCELPSPEEKKLFLN